MAPPRYQSIVTQEDPYAQPPLVAAEPCASCCQVAGAKGPAKTFTPIHVWDLRLATDQRTDLEVPDGYTTALAVLKGAVRVNGSDAIEAAEVGLSTARGRAFASMCERRDRSLLCGEPIDEPI